MTSAPQHSVQIWLDGGDIRVMYDDAGVKHTVTLNEKNIGIPADDNGRPLLSVRGWATLTRLLRDRAATTRSARIGESASVTQHQLEKMVKEFGGVVKVVGKKRSLGDMTLEDLGL